MDATHTRSTDFTADGDMMTVVLQQTDSTTVYGRRDQRLLRVACSSCAFIMFPSLLLLSSCEGRGQQQKQRTASQLQSELPASLATLAVLLLASSEGDPWHTQAIKSRGRVAEAAATVVNARDGHASESSPANDLLLSSPVALTLAPLDCNRFICLSARESQSEKKRERDPFSATVCRLCCQQQTATLNARSKAETGREEQRQRIRESGERVPMLLMPFNPFPSSSLACEVLQSFRVSDWLTEGDSERKRLLNANRKESVA